jgi:hypothetical protein
MTSTTRAPSADQLTRILNSSGPFSDEAQKDVCKKMVNELTEHEQEIAARTSYAYWVASELKLAGLPSNDVRTRMAMREARRHLVGERSYDKGLAALRECCAFRKERKVDLLRTLFDSSWKYDSDEDAKVAQQYRSYLEEELLKQVMVVRGKDRESHAVVIKMPRESPETNEEAFIMAQLYIAERAMAATEFLSCGENEKVVAIFEFGTYSSSNAPPFRVMRSMTTILQRNYPERLFHLVILDPPFFMRTIYTLIHPFLSADTNEKVILISNEKAKKEKLGSLISNEQAMPFMIPEGKLSSEIDPGYFLRKVPFFKLYDDDAADGTED